MTQTLAEASRSTDSADGSVVERLIPAAPSVSASLLLFAIGGLILILAVWGDLGEAQLAFYAAATAILAIAVFTLALRSIMRTPAELARLVFEQIGEHGGNIAFVTDQTGVVRHSNLKFKELPGSVSTPLAMRLERVSLDGEALLFRVLNSVRDVSRAQERSIAPDGTNWLISARPCARDFVIWWIVQIPNDTISTKDKCFETLNPALRVERATGTVARVNEAAHKLLGEIISLDALTGGSRAEHGEILRLPDKPRESYRVVRRSMDATHDELLLLPHDPNEVVPGGDFFEALPVALALVDTDGIISEFNDDFQKLLGARAKVGVALETLMEGLGRSVRERISDMARGRAHSRSEMARTMVDGQEVFLQLTLKRLRIDGTASILAVINDATELKSLEAQFVQSQKMQAVGQLAGGVAHDFNNLLTAINGHCELLLLRHHQGDADYSDLVQIRQNSNRAAALVGQLLAFSRKQTLLPKVLDLYNTFSELTLLLNRLLGERVSLRIDHDDNLRPVRVDERQIEQVIMNLVVNARDAMPDGGEVMIQTANVHFSTDSKRDNAVIPFGDYVQIDVRDTGVGIPQDKISKVFEPFFTTKKTGEGTGLGLSTVYGIIKQTGGFIFVESMVGRGTTFTILLPVHGEQAVKVPAESAPAVPEVPKDLTGHGVILLVEDETPVRSFAARALTLRGYTVIEAACAEEALDKLQDPDLHIDLFVSDVIMPGMDGPSWVKVARETRPGVGVVFVSGYAEDVFENGEISILNATFLPKPFTLSDLMETVKDQLAKSA